MRLRAKMLVTCKNCTKKYEKRIDTLKNWSGVCRGCHNKTNKVGKIYSFRKSCVDCGEISRWIKEQDRCKKCYWLFALAENNPNWQGGKTSLNNRIRRSKNYKEWRFQVFKRDDFTCKECGIKGIYLEADHIKPFSFYPELRFNLNNGRTLCRDCHLQYGWRKTKENLIKLKMEK